MKRLVKRNFLVMSFSIFLAGLGTAAQAHSDAAVMGIPKTFTGYAFITCSNDESGTIPTDYLEASVKDLSSPTTGLLVNLQIHNEDSTRAISITDPISGDAEPSDAIRLYGGNGVYHILVNKTGEGERAFEIEYHCKNNNGTHTVTEIGVRQFE